MATQVVKMRIQFRRDTTENWLLHKDVVPAAGEPCYDLDLKTLKIGDGSTTYEHLPVIGGEGSVAVAADGNSVVLQDGVFKLMGFDAAEVGAQPRKNAEGMIEWVVPSRDESMDTLLVEVDALRTDVTKLQEIVTPSGDDEVPLLTRIESLETKIDGTDENSVDAKIDAKITEFANRISDDGTVNTLKELVDYVAAHGNEAADMAADIATLQGLVGSQNVSDQINAAVSGLVKEEVDKGLSTNDFTDTLLEKLEGIEVGANVNKIESIKIGSTILDIVDKTVVIPIGAGLKVSDEITVDENGTLGIGTISFAKIVQVENETVIMDGGGASDE